MNSRATPARDRLLQAAAELFYADGMAATGIDAIIARAVFDGLAPAVREMRRLMVEARRGLPTSAP